MKEKFRHKKWVCLLVWVKSSGADILKQKKPWV